MQLRRFTADSTPAALGAVRMALGDDAIILANRRLGDQVEIIATGQIDDVLSMAEMSSDAETVTVTSKDNSKVVTGTGTRADFAEAPATQTSVTDSVLDDDIVTIGELSKSIESAESSAPPLDPSASFPTPVAVTQATAMSADFSIDSHQISLGNEANRSRQEEPAAVSKLYGSSSEDRESVLSDNRLAAEKNAQTPHANALEEPMTGSLADSLAMAMEAQSLLMAQHFKSLEVNLWGSNSPNRTAQLQRLFAMGIGAELAIRLVERCDPDLGIDEALRETFALLKSTLPIGSDKTLSVPGVTILSGPPGAGKTTALIKLATEHVRRFGTQSIVIICADTRRIGAFEELQAYGRLLGVPTVHAHDVSELDSLIDAFTHKQLVLVDHTLPVSESAIDLPRQLREPKRDDSVRHLFVLPATLQAATAEMLIAEQCHTNKMQCVLTHLDTSAKLGELFNAIIRHHLPIAYWSDAASVQQPLQKADASVLIATAVAMSRRIKQSPDDQWLQRLIQPSRQVFAEPVLSSSETAL